MDILIFDDMLQGTKEANGKQFPRFHEHKQNIPFGQITGSRAREPVNTDVIICGKELTSWLQRLLISSVSGKMNFHKCDAE